MTREGTIVVGVDGTEAGEAALRYATAEAARLGLDLRIVHVVPDLTALGGLTTAPRVPVAAMEGMGHRVLHEAATKALDVLSPERVELALLSGGVVDSLVTAAEESRFTVLGDQPRPVLGRIVTTSVLTGVSARATAPVIAVPLNWIAKPDRGVVVAAVKDCEHSEALVYRAMKIASKRKARLVLLHAWRLPAIYDDLVAERVEVDRWKEAAAQALRELVERHRREFPSVEIEFQVEHGQPTQVIVAASETADLLILARRPHVLPTGRLGGVGRAVLRESRCPVEVMPPANAQLGLTGFVLEEGGELEKEQEASLARA